MTERLTRVETKLDMLIQRLDPALLDYENRLRRLEQKVWLASGAALAGGGVAGTVFAHLTGA